MFAELFLCACAVAAIFSVLGAKMAVLIAMPLLVWSAYRLGRAYASSAAPRTHKTGTLPSGGSR